MIVIKYNSKMPCSICGEAGHNRRTCPTINNIDYVEPIPPAEPMPPKIDDTVLTMLIIENELRNNIINNKLSELTDEKIEFYETFLDIKKKEFNIINLDKDKKFKLFIMNNNSKLVNINIDNMDITDIDCSYLGDIEPREMASITSFTGYTYLVMDEYKMFDTIDVSDEMKDTQMINYIVDISVPSKYPTTKQLSNENRTLFASLKMNYLIKQMIRLGASDKEKYSGISPIIDLFQDIEMPQYDNIDLEAAGLPNEFTNVT